MNLYNERKYMLVIKRDNKDYLPLEWNLTKYYNGQNMNSLIEIDNFTKQIEPEDLLIDSLDNNMLTLDEKYKCITIIYNEKGRTRELKGGPIFIYDKDILDTNYMIDYIANNIDNKSFINTIITLIKDEDQASQEFKFILKNISLFKEKGKNAIKAALYKYETLPYEVKRYLAIEINNRYIKR